MSFDLANVKGSESDLLLLQGIVFDSVPPTIKFGDATILRLFDALPTILGTI